MKKSAVIGFLCTLLAGCAGMDRNQCLSASWYAIGLEDGARECLSLRGNSDHLVSTPVIYEYAKVE